MKFQLGKVFVTKGAKECIPLAEQLKALKRHANGDWGDISDNDKKVNDEALKDGDEILSAYHYNEIEFWIMTEWDRSVTTILLPEER